MPPKKKGTKEDVPIKEEEPLAALLEQGEEDHYNTYVTSEDLALLHETFEAKLQMQQVAAEKAAKERQLSLESKLEALMNLLGVSQEGIERKDVRTKRPSIGTPSPMRAPSLPRAPYRVPL